MRIKSILKTVAAGAALLALTANAEAATREINLYGASAQYLFWNDAADNFLATKGCSGGITQAQNSDGKHGITIGRACSSYANDDIIIRYSSKASYDGIYAMKGVGNPDSCATNFERKMANEATISGTTVGGTKCVDVTLGCSDVAGETFLQESEGTLKGHLGGDYVTRSFSRIDTTGLTPYRPLVVPFGFFAHNTVTLSNLSRLQAVMIYAGKVVNWNQFDAALPANQIVACLRHAGSGTHATLDAAVMRGDANLITLEDPMGIYGGPVVYFNDGSSDMMNCINDNAYAVGYADADLRTKPTPKASPIRGLRLHATTSKKACTTFGRPSGCTRARPNPVMIPSIRWSNN